MYLRTQVDGRSFLEVSGLQHVASRVTTSGQGTRESHSSYQMPRPQGDTVHFRSYLELVTWPCLTAGGWKQGGRVVFSEQKCPGHSSQVWHLLSTFCVPGSPGVWKYKEVPTFLELIVEAGREGDQNLSR